MRFPVLTHFVVVVCVLSPDKSVKRRPQARPEQAAVFARCSCIDGLCGLVSELVNACALLVPRLRAGMRGAPSQG